MKASELIKERLMRASDWFATTVVQYDNGASEATGAWYGPTREAMLEYFDRETQTLDKSVVAITFRVSPPVE